MKLWEVIKALTEDPTKKFELNHHGWTETLTISNGYLNYFQPEGTKLEDDVDVNNNNWQPVRQPATWQEAIQTWGMGRIVSVVVGGCKYMFTDAPNPELTRRMIEFGSWFVED